MAFEDPKPASGGQDASALSAQEWIDALDRAKEMGSFQPMSSYGGDEGFRELSSGVSSHANTLDRSNELSGGRNALVKNQGPNDSDSTKAKKRFSRRHSKNGLSAVF